MHSKNFKAMVCGAGRDEEDSISIMKKKMAEKMNRTSDHMEKMCNPRIHSHSKHMYGYDDDQDDYMMLHTTKISLYNRGLHREQDNVEVVKKETCTITLNSLVESYYKSFVIEDKNNRWDLLNEMATQLDIPIKNIKLYQDAEKVKLIRYDDEFVPLINDDKKATIYFEVTSDFGNFIKQEKLANGSFASVYKCTDYGGKDVWCVKKFKSNRSKIEDVLPINREIEVFSKLESHPRIVKLERNFQTEKASFIILEYMTQGSLSSYLSKKGALSEPEMIGFAKQILEAIDYLHGKNIIHRDLKGPKFLLDENLNVKLCGFVSAKILKGIPVDDFKNAASQSVVGTANWMAPEVINGEKYGCSADIWSFGAIMVEMMTGKPPYCYLASFQVIFKVGTTRKLEFLYPEHCSNQLKSFVGSCLDIDPMKRPSIKELIAHEFLK